MQMLLAKTLQLPSVRRNLYLFVAVSRNQSYCCASLDHCTPGFDYSSPMGALQTKLTMCDSRGALQCCPIQQALAHILHGTLEARQ